VNLIPISLADLGSFLRRASVFKASDFDEHFHLKTSFTGNRDLVYLLAFPV